jgi:hypothetical protein
MNCKIEVYEKEGILESVSIQIFEKDDQLNG